MMEPIIVFSTFVGIAMLAALDIHLAIQLWKERGDEIRGILLDIESAMIVMMSNAARRCEDDDS